MSTLIHLLNEYGYIILFLSLLLELIIIPIPNEALMSYVGVLAFHGKMNIVLAIISAGLGGIIGATVSYWIGTKLGAPFFKKYGRYIHMGPEKMEKMEIWYRKYGKVLLIFSYIVPGIRHIASIISGVIKLPYKSFAIFSYIGVFLWVSTFIFLGYSLGPKLDQFHGEIKKWLVLASIVVGIVVLTYVIIKANRQYIKESMFLLMEGIFKRFKRFYKMNIFIFFILAAFVTLFSLMVGMIQDFVANEFGHFDVIFTDIANDAFDTKWKGIISGFHLLATPKVQIIFIVLTVLMIIFNRKNIWLELLVYGITLMGTFLFATGIHWLFGYLFNNIGSNFPNEPTMFLVSVLGFFLFMLIRHHRNYAIISVLLICFALTLVAYSISIVYVGHNKPSDIMAGYVFGGAWLSGMILSLETFRFLTYLKKELKGIKK